MIVVAGDIGGTKTILQAIQFRTDHKQYDIIFEKLFPSKEYDSFYALIGEFMASLHTQHKTLTVESACLAVAGPIDHNQSDQTAKITSLPWEISTSTLQALLDIKSVILLNDFEAIGYGIELLKADELALLKQGDTVPEGNRVILGAGTGLGVCQVLRHENSYYVQATEGGHNSFAPTDKTQLEFLSYMLERHNHVSYDRVLSGPGLVNIFSFFVDKYEQQTHSTVKNIFSKKDVAQAITENIQELECCKLTIDLFAKIYGSQAGNTALVSLAYGGVYLAGGIAPKLLPYLKDSAFSHYFTKKGRMESLLKSIPVRVITNQKVGILGAAAMAYKSNQM